MDRSAHLRSDSQACVLLIEEGVHHSQHGQPSVDRLRTGTIEGHQITEVNIAQLRPTLPATDRTMVKDGTLYSSDSSFSIF